MHACVCVCMHVSAVSIHLINYVCPLRIVMCQVGAVRVTSLGASV